MAGSQGHFSQVAGVPGGDNLPAGSGMALDFSDQRGDLVDMATIRTDPVAPLLAVHRAQIAVPVGPLVPNAHVVFLEVGDIGVAFEEP